MILLLFSVSLYAQQDKENRKVELTNGTFVVPEKYPIVLKSVKPVYPREAILQDVQGKVFVKVTINESGKVEAVKIAKGISPSLNKSALAAAKKMEFSPAVYKGQNVKVSIAIPVNFVLDPEKKGPKLDTGISVTGEPDPSSLMRVEKNPEPIKLVKPHYPEIAQKAGITGIVILRVLVDKEGRPLKTKLIKADNEMFIEPSKDAAMKTMFTPAIQDGKPISCWINIPFKFSVYKDGDSRLRGLTAIIKSGSYEYYPKELSDKSIGGLVKVLVKFSPKKEFASAEYIEKTNTLLDEKAVEYIKFKMKNDGYLDGYMTGLCLNNTFQFIYSVTFDPAKGE
jgi:protein TonB